MIELWSTALIAHRQRADFWRDVVCKAFLSMTPRLDRAEDFRAQLLHQPVGPLALNKVIAPSHGVARTPSDLARGEAPLFFVNLELDGLARLRQRGRETISGPGRLLLIDSSESYELDMANKANLISLAIPQKLLGSDAGHAIDVVARPLPNSAAAALLAAQLKALSELREAISEDESESVAQVLVALVRMLVGHPRAPASSPRGGRFLYRRLRTLLERRIDDPALTPLSLAMEAGVSVRTVHACLAEQGTTFGKSLVEMRLERARALLRLGAEQKAISEIASQCGFRSAAHFSRLFRARFGVPPSAAR